MAGMLRFAISLRSILLIASLGAAIGALLMIWLGCAKMAAGVQALAAGHDAKAVIASVMGGTDAFLFSIVLLIFAYAIAFGFVFDLSPETRESLPSWMRGNGVSELKDTLVSVILVYLAVDFVTDWPEGDTVLSWQVLIKPISIFLIAAAFRLLASGHSRTETARGG